MTVSVASPNLQGTRTAVTAENGDYVLTLLPSGTYSVTFELSGFERVTQTGQPCANAGPAARSGAGAGDSDARK